MVAIKRSGIRFGALITSISMVFLFGCATSTEVYYPDVNESYYPSCCKVATPCKYRCMRACAPRTQCTCYSRCRATSCCGVVYGSVDSGTVFVRSSGSSVWQQLFIN